LREDDKTRVDIAGVDNEGVRRKCRQTIFSAFWAGNASGEQF